MIKEKNKCTCDEYIRGSFADCPLHKFHRLEKNKRLCENPKHKGENPPKFDKEDKRMYWWLKDPEWKLWCPRCVSEWWDKQFKIIIKKLENDKRKK